MPPKRFARFLSTSSVSRPERRPRVGETPDEFRKSAEGAAQQLKQFVPPLQAPAPPPPPPPEWPNIVGNDDHEWMDEEEDEPPVEVNAAHHEYPRFYRKRRYRTYFDKRQDYFKSWGQLENQMTSTYLYCQYATNNWTSAVLNSYLGIRPPGCSCTPQDQQNQRDVDLIDIIGLHSNLSMSFCSCPDAIQLLHQGYIASSPSQPRTAFSIRLIQLYHAVWQAGGLSKGAFIEGLLVFVSARNRKRLSGRALKEKTRALRVPFSNAFDVYIRIISLESSLFSEGMLHTKEDMWAAQCPRCFGPAENEDRTDQEFYSIFCMDGNFQQRHNTQASKDTPTDDQYPPIFVKPSEVQVHEASFQSTVNIPIEGAQNPCSDSHKAANDFRNTSTWAHCDDTGLFAASCRHDVPLRLVNIYKTGEKLYYPVTLIKSIIKDFPGKRFGVLYDIGCHLERHIKCRDLLPEDHERLQFATSVFHAYVHEWKCQIRYNPRYNNEWGLSDGEGLERLWSFLSVLVGVLRTSTRLHRLVAIFTRIMHFTEVIMHNSGKWLLARMKQAISTAQKSRTLLNNIYALPNPHKPGQKFTEEYLLEQWAAERKAIIDPKAQEEAQKLELGKLLCDEEEMDRAWSTVVRTPEQAIARARLLGDLQKQIEKQKKKIGINEITDGLKEHHTKLFLKVWYTKTAVRRLYLSIKEEKRPLEVVQQVGMSVKLGTRGEEKVLASIRARAAKLRPALDTYNRSLAAFKAAFPDRVAPRPMEYNELLASKPDDQFWNDGLFNYEDEPWAFDPPTQVGMRALARLRRCNEEKRRLRWETRRLMRWTTQQFQKVRDLLLRLGNHTRAGQDLATDARLKSFMDSPALTTLAPSERRIAVTVLVSKEFHRLCQLYESWNTPILEVFSMGFQPGDDGLARAWHYQMAQVTYLKSNNHSSMIPGDFEGVIDGIKSFCRITSEIQNVPNVPGGLAVNSNEDDDDDWEDDIEEAFQRDLHLEEIGMALHQIEQGEDDD